MSNLNKLVSDKNDKNMSPSCDSAYCKFFKRLLDFIFAFVAIVFLVPGLVILSILVRVKLGSPVLFKQDRPGLNEKIFTMYKFRTMTDGRDSYDNLLPDSVRLTKFGRILRSTSLDELPELFNILKGDMSFVGPRPLLVQYLSLYNNYQRRRHKVRPGLSGLAQINGRNAISWDEKFRLDIEYVDNIKLSVDLKIIFKTVKKVFFRDDINSETNVTMEPFRGNDL